MGSGKGPLAAALTLALLIPAWLVAAAPARAACDTAVATTVGGTPASDLCPEEKPPPPDPEPTPSKQPSSKPAHRPKPKPRVLGTQFRSPIIEPPSIITSTAPAPMPTPSFAWEGQGPDLPTSVFNAVGHTGPGLPLAPGSARGFWVRIMLMLGSAGVIGGLLYQARVRRWMLGL